MSDTTTPSNLGNIITNPFARRVIYGIYVIGVVILGAAQVAFSAVHSWGGQPDWLTAALAVAAYLGIPVGTLALANTGTSSAGDHAA
jgi:uncharacterized membrane protein